MKGAQYESNALTLVVRVDYKNTRSAEKIGRGEIMDKMELSRVLVPRCRFCGFPLNSRGDVYCEMPGEVCQYPGEGGIQVGKIDLDTITAAFLLLGTSRYNEVTRLPNGQASAEDLANPAIICIEVGGAGQTSIFNFDHHESGGPERSACWQAFESKGWGRPDYGPHPEGQHQLAELVDYVDQLDTLGCVRGSDRVEFPTLSDVVSGLLLTERDPIEQLHKGVELLRDILLNGIWPFGTIPTTIRPEWAVWAEAKAENNRQIASAVVAAKWAVTKSGRKLGYLETDFFGAPGALYGHGAEVVVAYSPNFGPERVPKFTIAGNGGIRVDAALPALSKLEEGWGGPQTGTIIGSPRGGSILTIDQVVGIVKEIL